MDWTLGEGSRVSERQVLSPGQQNSLSRERCAAVAGSCIASQTSAGEPFGYLLDSELPNADNTTGPWTQTMAAAAAAELATDGWLEVFSSDEETRPVDFEVFVLDHKGESHDYKRSDGLSHEKLLEMRREQDTRKIVMFLTWPPELKLYLPAKLRQVKEATKARVQAMLKNHAEHVGFGECKDDHGNLMPKLLIFIRHNEASSMAELATVLPQMRYIDVGLEVLMKTSISKRRTALSWASSRAASLRRA